EREREREREKARVREGVREINGQRARVTVVCVAGWRCWCQMKLCAVSPAGGCQIRFLERTTKRCPQTTSRTHTHTQTHTQHRYIPITPPVHTHTLREHTLTHTQSENTLTHTHTHTC